MDAKKTQSKSSSCYLTRIFGSAGLGNIDSNNLFRKYRVDCLTSLKLRGNTDTDNKVSTYYIGRHGAAEVGMERTRADIKTIDMSVRVGDYTATDFNGNARRYANFSGDFCSMDLAAVVERLAKGIAYYSVHGKLTPVILRGGGSVSMVAINATTAPVTASTNHVWVPRCADDITAPNTFCALVNAVSGSGSTVVTDLVGVDNHNNVEVPVAEDYDLAEGCYHALRLLGGNYEDAWSGDIFAYAVTRGVHAIVSVAGHTDEGAYMRTVLRAGSFGPSYGGIDTRKRTYIGLPRAMSSGSAQYNAFVDSIALCTAAAAAASDPLVEVDGRLFPTVHSVTGLPVSEGGSKVGVVRNAARQLANEIANASGTFCDNYCDALRRVMTIEHNSGLAALHLQSSFCIAAGENDRHLEMNVVAPYYWIEPTGLCDLPAERFRAVSEGYAQLGVTGDTTTWPTLPKARGGSASGGINCATFEWRSARTVGLVLHHHMHRQDGLGSAVFRQVDADHFGLIGHEGENVRTRMTRNRPISDWLWTRRHSAWPAPAEAIYTKGWVGAAFKETSTNMDTYETTFYHLPTLPELIDGEVTIRVSKVRAFETGEMRDIPRKLARDRTRAIIALRVAAQGLGAMCIDGLMPMTFSAPGGDVLQPSSQTVPSVQTGPLNDIETHDERPTRSSVPELASEPANAGAPVGGIESLDTTTGPPLGMDRVASFRPPTLPPQTPQVTSTGASHSARPETL
jgi:hypothetical protein